MRKNVLIIVAILNTLLSIVLIGFALFVTWFLVGQYFDTDTYWRSVRFTVPEILKSLRDFGMAFVMIIVPILSATASWKFVTKPWELISSFWKFLAFGSLIIVFVLAGINI